MITQEASLFPKEIKIDDYADNTDKNVIRIVESSNLLMGTGSRTSSSAIVLAKSLQYSIQEGAINIKQKTVLDLGCGVGFLGIYLCCLGANAILGDIPSMKELAERNININKKLLKGSIQFSILNWKNTKCTAKCQDISELQSSNSYEKHKVQCLKNLISKVDYTIVCECGGLSDLSYQLNWIGREGMFISFLSRPFEISEDFLSVRAVQEYLLQKQLHYEKIQTYHPDYTDQRVNIYQIWK